MGINTHFADCHLLHLFIQQALDVKLLVRLPVPPGAAGKCADCCGESLTALVEPHVQAGARAAADQKLCAENAQHCNQSSTVKRLAQELRPQNSCYTKVGGGRQTVASVG